MPDSRVELSRTVTLLPRSATAGMVSVQHTLRCSSPHPCSFASFEDVHEATLGKHSAAGGWAGELPDFVWSQSIKKLDEDVVSHWNFKSPALVVQEGRMMSALVADLGPPGKVKKGEMAAHPQLLDLTNPADTASAAPPTMAYGFAPTALSSHSIYSRKPSPFSGDKRMEPVTIDPGQSITLNYLLLLDTDAQDADKGGGTTAVASLLWERMGRAALLGTPQQQRNVHNASLNLFDTWQQVGDIMTARKRTVCHRAAFLTPMALCSSTRGSRLRRRCTLLVAKPACMVLWRAVAS